VKSEISLDTWIRSLPEMSVGLDLNWTGSRVNYDCAKLSQRERKSKPYQKLTRRTLYISYKSFQFNEGNRAAIQYKVTCNSIQICSGWLQNRRRGWPVQAVAIVDICMMQIN